jgi:hypothetical protein
MVGCLPLDRRGFRPIASEGYSRQEMHPVFGNRFVLSYQPTNYRAGWAVRLLWQLRDVLSQVMLTRYGREARSRRGGFEWVPSPHAWFVQRAQRPRPSI